MTRAPRFRAGHCPAVIALACLLAAVLGAGPAGPGAVRSTAAVAPAGEPSGAVAPADGITRPAAQPPVGAAPPELIATDDELVRDFGEQRPGDQMAHPVRLHNVSGGAIRLRISHVSCSCIEASVTPSVVPAGGTAEALIALVSLSVLGPQVHMAEVEATTEADPARTQKLTLTVSYTPKVELEPKPWRIAGTVYVGEEFRRSVFVRPGVPGADTGVRDLRCTVEGARVEGPSFVPGREDHPVAVVDLVGRYDSPGLREGAIEFNTNSIDLPFVRVPVSIMVRPAVWAVPAAVVIPWGHQQAEFRARVRLRRWDGADLPAMRVEFGGDAGGSLVSGAIEPLNEPGSSWPAVLRVTVRCPLGADRRPGVDHLRLVDDAGAEVLRIPVVWTPPPEAWSE